jgi:hypothetical protein
MVTQELYHLWSVFMCKEIQGDEARMAAVYVCSSESLGPFFNKTPLPLWLPVVISCNRNILHIEIKPKLQKAVEQIKRCATETQITSCRLIHMDNNKGKVFFSGFLIENIDYLDTESGVNDSQGKLGFVSMKIPFEFSTDIEYYLPPRLKKADSMVSVELPPGKFTPEPNFTLGTKPNSQDFLQCEILNIHAREVNFCTGLNPNETAIELILSISFLLTQKQCVYLR